MQLESQNWKNNTKGKQIKVYNHNLSLNYIVRYLVMIMTMMI